MHNIYFNSKINEGISFDTFNDKMINICNEHRESGKALIFAFIIYDFASPHVSKILHDDDYWMALNTISGNKISIFSIHKPLSIEEPAVNYRSMYDVYPPNKYDPHALGEQIANKYFPVEIESPSIIFFQVDKEQVIDAIIVGIKETLQEEAYEEIKDYIKTAVISISDVKNDYRNNHQEIFNLLSHELQSKKNRKTIISIIKGFPSIYSILKEFNIIPV